MNLQDEYEWDLDCSVQYRYRVSDECRENV